jgi:hypothetical protein
LAKKPGEVPVQKQRADIYTVMLVIRLDPVPEIELEFVASEEDGTSMGGSFWTRPSPSRLANPPIIAMRVDIARICRPAMTAFDEWNRR